MDRQQIWQYLWDPIDLYCERTDAGLWAEPLNLMTNAAFLATALILYTLAGKVERELARKALVYLAMMAGLVGVGSSLFHSLANRLSQAADVIPITFFVAMTIYFYFRERSERDLPLGPSAILAVFIIVLTPLAVIILGLSPYLAHGEFYFGLVPSLLLLAYSEENKAKRRRILFSALFFGIALAARSLDARICQAFPHGTHFLWHLGTAAVALCMGTVLAIDERKAASVN